MCVGTVCGDCVPEFARAPPSVCSTFSLVVCIVWLLLHRFTATAMPGGMYDFAAVSPPGSNVVLTFGGVDSGTGRHRDGIDMYDR